MARVGRIVAGIVAAVAGVGVVRAGRIFRRRLWRRIRWGGIEGGELCIKGRRGVVSYAVFFWWPLLAIMRTDGECGDWARVDMRRSFPAHKILPRAVVGDFFLYLSFSYVLVFFGPFPWGTSI